MRTSVCDTAPWVVVRGIETRTDLLDLAHSVGQPVPSPSGDLVKVITPRCAVDAPRGTLSGKHGTGPFPLHTDTAFWPVPARFLVLRVRGDFRRPTVVCPFDQLFDGIGSRMSAALNDAVWLVRQGAPPFYCSMKIRGYDGWRYDANCMSPANRTAAEVDEFFRSVTASLPGDVIHWTGHEALVICNWTALHGRGAALEGEQLRVLERVYVR